MKPPGVSVRWPSPGSAAPGGFWRKRPLQGVRGLLRPDRWEENNGGPFFSAQQCQDMSRRMPRHAQKRDPVLASTEAFLTWPSQKTKKPPCLKIDLSTCFQNTKKKVGLLRRAKPQGAAKKIHEVRKLVKWSNTFRLARASATTPTLESPPQTNQSARAPTPPGGTPSLIRSLLLATVGVLCDLFRGAGLRPHLRKRRVGVAEGRRGRSTADGRSGCQVPSESEVDGI